MKPAMHTKEWLCWARDRARLTRKELAERAGLSFSVVLAIEKGERGGSPETWAKLDAALYLLLPAVYVDEDALLDTIRKCGKRSNGRSKCRLYYAAGADGIAFTDVLREDDDSLSGAYIVVTWAEAEALLELQKSIA